MHGLFIYLSWTVHCGMGMICDTVDSPEFTEVVAESPLEFKTFLKFGHNVI